VSILLRAFVIVLTCCRYRLDTLLPRRLPWFIRHFFLFFPNRINNRGIQLRKTCEELGPIFIKFGQLLSTRPDLVPLDIVRELDRLQDRVAPFPVDTFKAIVARELGQSVEELFANFDEKPLGSASIAQVHAAKLKNGHNVVVKVVRPSIEKIIDKDMRLLLWIARKLEKWLPDIERLKPVEIVSDYRHTIFDELDLSREAANASQLRRNFLHSPLLYVPEVYWDYCNQRVMVMERIYGIQITKIDELKAQQTDMKRLAERGIDIFFTQVFEHNFFHADMHPGNIFVSRERPDQPQYIAVDMAIVGSLTREDQYYLARNLLAMFRRDYRLVAELHVQCGWVPKETKIGDFESAVRSVCEPIFERPLAQISFGQVMITLFSTAQRFNMEVQPQLVLLQKTLLNIEGLGRQLYPELDLWETAHPYLERWLKNRFSPRTLLRELKRYGPEWLEKFPEAPTKILRNLETLEIIKDLSPTLQKVAEDYHSRNVQEKRHWFRYLLTVALAGTAVYFAWPQLHNYVPNMPLESWALGLLAILAWKKI
jgi:ubiquinone biosynthesis protein